VRFDANILKYYSPECYNPPLLPLKLQQAKPDPSREGNPKVLHPSPSSMHPAPCTLHPVPCTLISSIFFVLLQKHHP